MAAQGGAANASMVPKDNAAAPAAASGGAGGAPLPPAAASGAGSSRLKNEAELALFKAKAELIRAQKSADRSRIQAAKLGLLRARAAALESGVTDDEDKDEEPGAPAAASAAAPAARSGFFSGLFSRQIAAAGAGKAPKAVLSLAAQGVTEELIEGDGTIFFFISGKTTPLSFFTDIFTGADPPAGSVQVTEILAGYNPFGQKNIRLTRQLAQNKYKNITVKIEQGDGGYKVVVPNIVDFLDGIDSVKKFIAKIKSLEILGDVSMSVLQRDGHIRLEKQGGGYRRRSNRRSKTSRKNKTSRKSRNNRKNRQSRKNRN